MVKKSNIIYIRLMKTQQYHFRLFVATLSMGRAPWYWVIRGATFWVILKNHDAAPTKFQIGHLLTLGSTLDPLKIATVNLTIKNVTFWVWALKFPGLANWRRRIFWGSPNYFQESVSGNFETWWGQHHDFLTPSDSYNICRWHFTSLIFSQVFV